jgi:AraC family transcriptional regulator, arabinose operon regulatory protein
MLALSTQIGWLSRNPSASALEIIGPSVVPRNGLRKVRLTLDEVRPVIHLAHRLRGPLHVPRRIILDHEILLILNGNGEIQVGHDALKFTAGDLFVMAPFVPHHFVCRSAGFEHIAVHFRFAQDQPSLGELHDQRPYGLVFGDGHELTSHVHLATTDPLRASLENLVRLWAENTPLATLKAEALLMSAVARLLLRPRDSERPLLEPTIDPRILNALDWIEGPAAAPPRISELAAAVNLGTTQFNLLFRDSVNETPAAYIRRRRATRARELLEETDLPVKAIALSQGFRDAAHFSRSFFKACGCWPTEYRKRRRVR